ncbi:MAG TPA: S-layer homology domain-containing protein, partial [Bacilli bacterium]
MKSHWAKKYIASLAAKKVFAGYADGTFQPNKPVSRIEAITAAVKLMGLKAQAEAKMNVNLNFKDGDRIEKKYPWAVGYVAIALENDLFEESEDSIQPEKAADRLWATILLVKASKLTAEAKAKMNTELNFTDADKIPAGAVGYVAIAVEKGFIKGYKEENNKFSFRPNKPITRAELAVLLDNTDSEMPNYEKNTIKGTISGVVSSTNVLTIVLKDQSLKQVTLHANAFIFRNGIVVASSALVAGDVVIIRSYNNTVYYIEVVKLGTGTPPVETTFTSADIKVEATSKNTIKITALNGHTFNEADLNAIKFRNDAAVTALTGVGSNDQIVVLGTQITKSGTEIILTSTAGDFLSASAQADSNDDGTALESLKLYIEGNGIKDQNGKVLTIAATEAVSAGHTNVADKISPLAADAAKITLAANFITATAEAIEPGATVKLVADGADAVTAAAAGTATVGADGSFAVIGLTAATAYDLYVVDAAANISAKLDIATP